MFSSVKEELFFDLQKRIEDVSIAFTSLKDNYRLHHLLEVALALGNYLNGTTFKGGAWGFKLDTIDRIEQIKSKDGKMTGGFYLIREVWTKFHFPIIDKE